MDLNFLHIHIFTYLFVDLYKLNSVNVDSNSNRTYSYEGCNVRVWEFKGLNNYCVPMIPTTKGEGLAVLNAASNLIAACRSYGIPGSTSVLSLRKCDGK